VAVIKEIDHLRFHSFIASHRHPIINNSTIISSTGSNLTVALSTPIRHPVQSTESNTITSPSNVYQSTMSNSIDVHSEFSNVELHRQSSKPYDGAPVSRFSNVELHRRIPMVPIRQQVELWFAPPSRTSSHLPEARRRQIPSSSSADVDVHARFNSVIELLLYSN